MLPADRCQYLVCHCHVQDYTYSSCQVLCSPCFLVSVKTSKFRHLKGDPLHKSNRIENIRGLSNSVSGESDGLALNRTHCAISLQGPAGLVAVLEVRLSGCLVLSCITESYD